jgi:hypothetical protein
MGYTVVKDYWLPDFKWQFVDWFKRTYPNVSVNRWQKMSKARLMAIYCAIRSKRG